MPTGLRTLAGNCNTKRPSPRVPTMLTVLLLQVCHPEVRTYKRYAKWEERQGEISRARTIYERAMVELGDEANSEALFVDFAQFEERHKEVQILLSHICSV